MGFFLLMLTTRQQAGLSPDSPLRLPSAWYAMGIAVFSLTVVAGVMLLRSHPHGIRLSTLVQVAQVVQFGVPGLATYQFTVGLQLLLAITPYGVMMEPGLTSAFTALPMSRAPYWILTVNLVPVMTTVVLLRAARAARASHLHATLAQPEGGDPAPTSPTDQP